MLINTNVATSFARKIGNTTYTVKVCCNEAARETFEDKLFCLLANGYRTISSSPETRLRSKGAPA